ncbi:MAG: hypothetical protein JWM87_1331 [Candidatus Eremiobacteraeota bacterium]|nr:hypothetical protein [Candidatus Eremiobacteraeota bacterium]
MNRLAKLAAPALVAAAIILPTAARADGLVRTLQGALLGERQRSAVTLASVAKELQPGVYEVDPRAVMGRRVVFSANGAASQLVCIGHWSKNACNGILIDTRPQTGGADSAPVPAQMQIPAPEMPAPQPSGSQSSTPPPTPQ